jgi:hypothetical protein
MLDFADMYPGFVINHTVTIIIHFSLIKTEADPRRKGNLRIQLLLLVLLLLVPLVVLLHLLSRCKKARTPKNFAHYFDLRIIFTSKMFSLSLFFFIFFTDSISRHTGASTVPFQPNSMIGQFL